jgi:predicted CXXCH cytochrome family protein
MKVTGKISSKCLFLVLIAVFCVTSMGSSYYPTYLSNEIIAEKKSDIHKYHFKDNAYDCTTCHSDAQQEGYDTVKMESNTCYECHNRVDEDEWVHGPVGIGECSVCHDPHGSKNAQFLVRKGEKLCTYCHDARRVEKHIGKVNSSNCTGCHNPHGGATTTMLRQ